MTESLQKHLVLPVELEDLEVAETPGVRGGAALEVSLAPISESTDIFGGGRSAKVFRIPPGR
jgi:hypothetical protein